MANKKRRRLPEEDLAAAVAEIINSPITRSNLSFLRSTPAEEVEPAAVALSLSPLPYESTPPGLIASAVGVSEIPSPLRDDSTPLGNEPVPPESGEVERWQPMALAKPLWQAEGLGSIFEHSRVRRIEHARDALSPVEQRVYELLWNTGSEGGSGDFRLVYYSLQRIATEARINIKTVRELIPRLMEKGFIRIEHKADVRRNIPTLYRVPGYDAVLFGQKRQNRLYIAKTGKGVFYVHPVSAQLQGMGRIPGGLAITPLGDRSRPSAAQSTAQVDGTAPLSPATSRLLASAIRQSLGAEPDEALLSGMVAACHENARAATGEAAEEAELLYFTQAKAQVLAGAPNIRNHLAVLRKAVPECFSGDTFRAYRAAALRREGKRGGAD